MRVRRPLQAWGGAAVAALALAACGAEPTAPAARAARPIHVVLVTIESLRTDHVGAYGGRSTTVPSEPITPVLDALAREAVVYEHALAPSSWTLASHASLFTGLGPLAHQTRLPRSRLGDDYTTLAERLADAGHQTAAVVSGPYLRRPYNLVQGFSWLDERAASPLQVRAHSDVTNPAMERGLLHFVERVREPERPFFLFAYFWDPHYDFLPPSPYDRMFLNASTEPIDVHDFDTSNTISATTPKPQMDFVVAQYDGEIRATDAALGRIFALLRGRGLWDDALVVVTADHGEAFFDHGRKGHKKDLHVETVHVPLIVKYPRGVGPPAGSRDARPASLVDIAPTVLDVLGLEAPARPEAFEGRSLLAEPDADRPLFLDLVAGEYVATALGTGLASEQWSAVEHGGEKLLLRRSAQGREDAQLFDVVADPREQHDLAGQRPAAVARLRALLDAHAQRARERAARHAPAAQAQLDEAEIEQLRALGYVE